ncbi:MAG: DDE-type integrase/transposase/recombinase [Verrucomicrobiales bacterium]|nr:DDE-type integrase/transposase/recombinase [Verrucomicrobiales bacterium]
MATFRRGEISASAAAETLGLGRTRFYEVYSDYLRAAARHQEAGWSPGCSGGDHSSDWPKGVEALLRHLLSSKPPAPYRFVASEVLRRLSFQIDPATVRRWALANQLAHPLPPPRRSPAALRRWQCLKLGALWQLDATPHRWFPGDRKLYPLLDLLDDCTRICTGAKIYHGEDLSAYLDFLPAAFAEHGLPLELYVDCHSLFFPQRPDALTQLGAALQFYGISLRYARTPQAKGKIERQHLYWQGRLPAIFAAEAIASPEKANSLLNELRRHRNAREIHREIGHTPDAAAAKARREKRCVLRPMPKCPWWPYVWSVRSQIQVGPDGRVPAGSQRIRVELAPGSRLYHCQHPDGSISFLAHPPKAGERPALILHISNR